MNDAVRSDREEGARSLGERWAGGWNNKDFADLAAVYSPACQCRDMADGSSFEGHEGLRGVFDRTLGRMPDSHNEALGSFATGDDYAMEWEYSATIDGEKRSIRGVSIGKLDDQGRILTRRDYWDRQQLYGT